MSKRQQLFMEERVKTRCLVIDGRDHKTKDQIRGIAQRWFKIQLIQPDSGPDPGDHGFYLAGDPLHYYHVASVTLGMYVASLDPMTKKQTTSLVKKFLEKSK